MTKFKTTTLTLIETAIERFQQGGYVNGDYIRIGKSITSSPFFKKLPVQSQEHIQKCIDTDLKLRVSSVKSIRPAIQQVDGGMNAAGDFVVDVVIEYAPGLYKNPISLPVEFVELQATGSEGFGTLAPPESVVYKNKVHGPENIKSQSLPDKNIQIPHGNPYIDSPGGVQPGVFSKDHLAGAKISEEQLEDVYSDLIEKKNKPDYLDIDNDGDTKEPMKKAVKAKHKNKSKKEVSESLDLESTYMRDVVNEQPDNLTPEQEHTVNKLLNNKYRINKISHQHAEQDGGPTVYMNSYSGASMSVAEVSPDGMVNGSPVDAFIGDIEQDNAEIEIEDLGDDAVNLASPIKKPIPDWQKKLRRSFERG